MWPRSARRRANAVPHEPAPTTTTRIGARLLRASHEVDRHGHPLQLVPVAELVLDPVAVVARDEAGIVDEEAEARRPGLRLRAVQEVQPARPSRGRLPRLPELAEEAVQLARRDPRRV